MLGPPATLVTVTIHLMGRIDPVVQPLADADLEVNRPLEDHEDDDSDLTHSISWLVIGKTFTQVGSKPTIKKQTI